MILKQIHLYPDRIAFPIDFVSAFQDQARHLCHLIGNDVAAAKFRTNGFNRLCIIASHNPKLACDQPTGTGALVVEVKFDREEYEKLSSAALPEYFLRLLIGGIEKTAKEYSLPLDHFHAAIGKLRDAGYKNVWTHSEKTFRKERLKCKLLCELTMKQFVLTLSVTKDGQSILHQEILTTPPDEIAFHHRFKELKLDGQKIIVQDRFGKLVCEFDFQARTYAVPPPDWRQPFPNGKLSAQGH